MNHKAGKREVSTFPGVMPVWTPLLRPEHGLSHYPVRGECWLALYLSRLYVLQ